MADGNGSIADREDNKSLDAADSSGVSGGSGNDVAIGGRSWTPGAGDRSVIAGVNASVTYTPPGSTTTLKGSVNLLDGETDLSTEKEVSYGPVSITRTTSLGPDGELSESYGASIKAGPIDLSVDINPEQGTISFGGSKSIAGTVGAGLDITIDYLNAVMNQLDHAWNQGMGMIGQQAWNSSGNPFGMSPPLVLDLDGDGLDLVALDKSKAFYDIDGDGYLENVGWVGDGDGFLSIDLNGDGLINEPKELAFALSTDDPDDTDLEGLAATYDSNQDGVLDANDADFAKFKVWIDIDQDGTCDAGEVKSLAEVGVTSINLTSDNKEEVIAGNKVYGTTSYTKTDGTTGKVGDVGLATSAAGWKKEEVSGGIKFNYEGPPGQPGNPNNPDNAGKSLFEAAAATALIMDVGASGLIGAMGAELDDDLSTSGKEDVILGGGAGNDKIKGGDGNDWLAGGEGIDSISGGAGHDILFVDSQDKIDGGKGFDVAIVTDDKAVTYDLAKIGIEAVAAGAGDDVLNGARRNAKRMTLALAA